MQLSDTVFMLPIPIVRDGQTNFLNLSLVLDGTHGPALIDTGLPGQVEAITLALAEIGLQISDLRQIILTHQDIDHVGSLYALWQASAARILASATEAPYIDGTSLPRFAQPAILAQRPELRPLAEQFQYTAVDQLLQDGERLDLAGGVRVIYTPGHTPGHMSLYLEHSKILIAGDSLSASDGQLHGPNPGATLDMATASRSVRAMAAVPVDAIICYHGGLVRDQATAQLLRVAAELEQQYLNA